MDTDTLKNLRREMGELKAQCEELRVRNEMLQYHLERTQREMRDMERELQELLHATGVGAPPPPTNGSLGWGKGKDE